MEELIQVTKSSMPPFDEYCEEIRGLWSSRWLTNDGEIHKKLEDKLKRFLNVSCVQLFSNGHLALELALNVLNLKGEVITTPFTFASTTQAILRNGLKPVFCDIDTESYCIDPYKIENLITENTSAIVPVHVYGNICDYTSIEKIAKKYNLKVVYDAAHAFGETVDDMNVSGLGDISMFSFHATKVFHTIEGGCLTFNDNEYTEKLSAVRHFGMYGKEDAEIIGINAKMTEFQAAMGICNLRHISEYIYLRRICAERYRERLSDVNGIKLSPIQKNVESNFAYFPIVIDKKIFGENCVSVADRLSKKGIYTRRYFYPLTSEFSVMRDNVEPAEMPVAKQISDNVITLPLYSELTVKDVDRICDIILS